MSERTSEQVDGVSPAYGDDRRPATLIWATRLIGLLVVFSGVVVLLVVLRHDDLLRSWAEGNPSARKILHTEGLEALKHPGEFDIKPPHFVAPALTLWAVVAALLGVLTVFLRNGFEWARIMMTILLLVTAVASVGGIMTGPPALFIVLTLVAIVIGIAAIVSMWLPATTRFLHPDRARELARLRDAGR